MKLTSNLSAQHILQKNINCCLFQLHYYMMFLPYCDVHLTDGTHLPKE